MSELSINLLFPVLNERLRLENGIERSMEYLKKNVSSEKYSEYENGYDNIYINYFVSGSNESKSFVKCKNKEIIYSTKNKEFIIDVVKHISPIRLINCYIKKNYQIAQRNGFVKVVHHIAK